MTVDPEALAAWNLGVVRARHTYERDPFAGARSLGIAEGLCSRCRDRIHRACTGRMGSQGRLACPCDDESHDDTEENA